MYSDIVTDIIAIVEREVPFLESLSGDVIMDRLNGQQRSIKMLVGHMVDSASNNHQRMVRLQYAPRCGHPMPNTDMGMLTFPDYTQDNDLWIHLQDYQHEDWSELIELWRSTNLHICHVIRSVDESKLQNYWLDYEGHRVTLDDMIRGYLSHLQLHVGQIHQLMEQS